MQTITRTAAKRNYCSNAMVTGDDDDNDDHNDDGSNRLTHVDGDSGQAEMVDVSSKFETYRKAIAQATVYVGRPVVKLIERNSIKKGDVLATARIAGIMAAKATSSLIPLCHPLPLTKVKVDIKLDGDRVLIETEVATMARTGVEMEAITAASIAALTIYDMCKSVSRSITIKDIKLIIKTGGKSDYHHSDDEKMT